MEQYVATATITTRTVNAYKRYHEETKTKVKIKEINTRTGWTAWARVGAIAVDIALSRFTIANELTATPILGPHTAVLATAERLAQLALRLRVLPGQSDVSALGTGAGGRAVHDGRCDGERGGADGPHRELGLVLNGGHGALAAIGVRGLAVVASLQHVLKTKRKKKEFQG